MSSPVRRSGRSRRQVTTIYDEQAEALTASAQKRKRKQLDESDDEKDSNKEQSENESNDDQDQDSNNGESDRDDDEDKEEESVDEDAMSSTSSSSHEDGDDEAYGVTKASPKRQKATVPRPKAIQIRFAKGTKKTKNADTRSGGGSYKQIANAMQTLARKVLLEDDKEVPDTSLLAALLLNVYRTGTSVNKKRHTGAEYNNRLDEIAARFVTLHVDDPNTAQKQLFDLIFRSIGGTSLMKNNVILEALNEDDWSTIITDLVDEMSTTPEALVLLTPSSSSSSSNIAIREYAKVYKDFWRAIGRVALSYSNSSDDSDSDDNASNKPSQVSVESVPSLQIEVVREVTSRLLEIAGVGQPDLRFAIVTALYELAQMMLDETVALQGKISVATRQHQAAARSKSTRKAVALKQQIQKWQRIQRDLQELVESNIIAGVFARRYRDSNEHIRVLSLMSLSNFCASRPDIFLKGTFLKYFGWMLSDKSALVRRQAVAGLARPLAPSAKVDTSNMTNVIDKFAPRLADMVLDVDTDVQEDAMALLLTLSKKGLLDSVQDDKIWEQINLRALASDASVAVRQNALLFVLEQLEAFDPGSASSGTTDVEKILAITSWIAHTISDGNIELESVGVELTDHVVVSLHASEHSALLYDWPVLLRALDQCSSKGQDRVDVVQQRVIMRMLVCAAELRTQLSGSEDDRNLPSVDPDWVAAKKLQVPTLVNSNKTTGAATTATDKKKSKRAKKNDESEESVVLRTVGLNEDLTIALLSKLPDLLSSYNSDPYMLQSLAELPLYFDPNIYTLPNRKDEYVGCLESLSELFLNCTEKLVAQKCAMSLTVLAARKHARNVEALTVLKKTALSVKERLEELSSENDKDKDDQDCDKWLALLLCLRKLSILSKRWYLGDLLTKATNVADGDAEIEKLRSLLLTVVIRELEIRKPVANDDDVIEIPALWTDLEPRVHQIVSEVVEEYLDLMVTTIGWRLLKEPDVTDGNTVRSEFDVENDTHIVIDIRDSVMDVLALCVEQYIESQSGLDVSQEQLQFAEQTQMTCSRILGDLRMLLPREWENAESPLLQALSLTTASGVITGCLRFLCSKNDMPKGNDADVEKRMLYRLLLSFARGLATNWPHALRREAAYVLPFLTRGDDESKALVAALHRVLKKADPVRLLEAQMSCLRQEFEDWIQNEPIMDNDHPSETELIEYEAAGQKHSEQFHVIEQLGSRLAASLGVGTLSGKISKVAVFDFIKEAIRYSFSTDLPGKERLAVGSRLSFLRATVRYLMWIKRDRRMVSDLKVYFDDLEDGLRRDPEYAIIYEEDIATIAEFRRTAGIGVFKSEKTAIIADDGSDDDDDDTNVGDGSTVDENVTVSSRSTRSRRRRITGGVSSSMATSQSTLSPVRNIALSLESAGDDDDELRSKASTLTGKSERSRLSRASLAAASHHSQITPEDEDSDDGSM